MVGTGTLSEDVSAATYDLEMDGVIHLLSCKGDASQSKKCELPLGAGSLSFDAMSFPLKAGQTQVKVDIALSANLPASLATTTTKATATATNGDKLFCIEIKSSKSESSAVLPRAPQDYPVATMKTSVAGALAAAASATDLKLTWSDCGDASTKAKITSFSPDHLTLGQTTTMVGTGTLSEDVSAATYDLEMDGVIHLLSCKGDASQSKTCALPLSAGTLSFDAMSFPLKAGPTQ